MVDKIFEIDFQPIFLGLLWFFFGRLFRRTIDDEIGVLGFFTINADESFTEKRGFRGFSFFYFGGHNVKRFAFALSFSSVTDSNSLKILVFDFLVIFLRSTFPSFIISEITVSKQITGIKRSWFQS